VGSDGRIWFFPILGGIFIDVIYSIFTGNAFSSLLHQIKKNKDLKYLISNRGTKVEIIIFDPLYIKYGFNEMKAYKM
jgi:hypothetical protein